MRTFVNTHQFQSTLPRGERRGGNIRAFHGIHYFNPRSREGSDYTIQKSSYEDGISIHAPARGATAAADFSSGFFSDFNPRSREGSDNLRWVAAIRHRNFNPRSREGSDEFCDNAYSPGCYFNPRSREGSDRRNGRYRPYCPQFQSTLPRGERLPIGNLTSQLFAFQSTLPRGERPVYGRYGGRTFRDFNPRSREGSDGHYYDCSATANEFQSTLPRGERLHTRLWIMQYVIQFQSTLPRGERPAIPPC